MALNTRSAHVNRIGCFVSLPSDCWSKQFDSFSFAQRDEICFHFALLWSCHTFSMWLLKEASLSKNLIWFIAREECYNWLKKAWNRWRWAIFLDGKHFHSKARICIGTTWCNSHLCLVAFDCSCLPILWERRDHPYSQLEPHRLLSFLSYYPFTCSLILLVLPCCVVT